MPVKRLRQYLDEHKVKYLVISHSPAYTAQEIAESAHISGKHVAKTVIVKQNDRFLMVVVPADQHVDFDALQKVVSGDTITIAGENEFAKQFPECDVGMMPPLGNLYDMPVYMDKALKSDTIVFNAGRYTELVEMAYDDFVRLVKPIILS